MNATEFFAIHPEANIIAKYDGACDAELVFGICSDLWSSSGDKVCNGHSTTWRGCAENSFKNGRRMVPLNCQKL